MKSLDVFWQRHCASAAIKRGVINVTPFLRLGKELGEYRRNVGAAQFRGYNFEVIILSKIAALNGSGMRLAIANVSPICFSKNGRGMAVKLEF